MVQERRLYLAMAWSQIQPVFFLPSKSFGSARLPPCRLSSAFVTSDLVVEQVESHRAGMVHYKRKPNLRRMAGRAFLMVFYLRRWNGTVETMTSFLNNSRKRSHS